MPTDKANPGTKNKKFELRVLKEMQSCRHFKGIQHDLCKAGVDLRKLVGGPDLGWAIRIPCIPDNFAARRKELGVELVPCELRSFWTREEAEANEHAADKAIAEFLANLATGTCPVCKLPVKQSQVGHCVYGTCGHRLYQGKVNPEFAEKANV